MLRRQSVWVHSGKHLRFYSDNVVQQLGRWLGHQGERNGEGGALSGARLHSDPAAVRLDEATGDREPQPRAAGVAAPEERLEDL